MHAQHQQYRPQPRRSRAPIVLAAVLAAGLVVGVAAVLIAYTRSPEAAGYDQATIRACEAAKEYHDADGPAAAVLTAAASSGRAELRKIAERYGPRGENSVLDGIHAITGALETSTWCIRHGMG